MGITERISWAVETLAVKGLIRRSRSAVGGAWPLG
jgi:hypothetical protein